MDRQIVYLGQVPRSLDVMLTGQNAMVGLAKLSEAILGTATLVQGFAISPTSPTSPSVIIAAGQIFEQENLEASAISGLAVDTHTIVKQGINLDPQVETLTAPTTIGFSWNILIEAQYADSDAVPIVLTYQNPANNDQTFQGPANALGTAQNTIRKGVVSIQAKYGTAATSNTQTTPSPDAGWVGLGVITVAYGQTAITGGNIAPYIASPFIPTTLPAVPAGVQSGVWQYGQDNGVANALNVVLNPSNTVATVGQQICVRVANQNTGASTIVVNGQAAVQITLRGSALTGKELGVNRFAYLIYDGTYYQLVGASQAPPAQYQTSFYVAPGTYTYTVPPNVTLLKISVWGGGGAGASVPTSSNGSAGGGGGGFSQGTFTVTPGATYTITVGAGAPRPAAGANSGTAGSTSSFGSLISATGGAGSVYGSNAGHTAGGVGSGGTLNITGGYGRVAFLGGDSLWHGGDGGASWCSGDTAFANGGQHDGQMPGQGGSGGSSLSGAQAGGAGASGAVFVECVG